MLASGRNGTLYLGVTAHLMTRVTQHRTDVANGFTKKYTVHSLVWFENHETMAQAIAREKAIKEWRRAWKVQLIAVSNPYWLDLYPSLL